MLTDKLKIAIEHATELPAEIQDLIAQQIEDAYWDADNAHWDKELRSPEHLEILAQMADEAWNEPGKPFPTPNGEPKP